MTKHVLGALAAVGMIAVIGYLVSSRSLATDVDAPAPPAPVAERPSPTAVTAPVLEPVKANHVVAVTGRVERRAGTEWVPVVVGDRLSERDTIRTAEGASATLDVGGLVEVDDLTELTVGEITASLAEVALAEGRVTASAGERGGTTIRISTRDAGAVAQTDHGRFDVLSSGKGQVTVAATEGEVAVTAKGTTVVVPAGKLSTVRSGTSPSAPRDIPPSLFLKVSAAASARDRAALRGTATPGAVVSINGVRTAADEQGQFTGEVPLRIGANTIVVSVEDATGRRERRIIERTVSTAKRKLETAVEWK